MNITDYFNHDFEIISADTDALLEEVLRLRYQVYCVEKPLADPKPEANAKECDIYDCRSVHSLIRHKATNLFVASVRLILPDPTDVQKKFPMEIFSGEQFYDKDIAKEASFRTLLGEISRFLVSKEREQLTRMSPSLAITRNSALGLSHKRDGLRCYLLVFGLMSAIVRMTSSNNILYWYAGLDPVLHRLLKSFGLIFPQIGPAFEYHGKRLPCLAPTNKILSEIRSYRPDLWKFLTKDRPPYQKEQHQAYSLDDLENLPGPIRR